MSNMSYTKEADWVPELAVGTVLKARDKYESNCGCPGWREGAYLKVVKIQESIFKSKSNPHHGLTYRLLLCSKSGKEFKTDFYITAMAIDKRTSNGEFTIISTSAK